MIIYCCCWVTIVGMFFQVASDKNVPHWIIMSEICKANKMLSLKFSQFHLYSSAIRHLIVKSTNSFRLWLKWVEGISISAEKKTIFALWKTEHKHSRDLFQVEWANITWSLRYNIKLILVFRIVQLHYDAEI